MSIFKQDPGAVSKESHRHEPLAAQPAVSARMLGFWDAPHQTAAAFHGAWFRTGDIGTLDPTGALALKGRIKTEINELLARHTGKEVDAIKTDTERDFWMTASRPLILE